MTVSSSVNKVIYSGNSATVLFPVNYYFLENSHLKVILRSSAGVETVQALTTNYTVTGAGNPAGGSITMLVAPATGTTLTIVRNVPATQETDYLANDPFPAESHERALDKLTMLTQENEEIGSRSIQIPQTDPVTTNIIVPKISDRASRLLGFGSNGSVAVSGSTIPQVDAAVAAITTIASAPSGNSAGISHIGAGTGAVPTTVQAKLRENITPLDFGVVADGIVDDTAAWQLWINYCASIKAAFVCELRLTSRITSGLVFPLVLVSMVSGAKALPIDLRGVEFLYDGPRTGIVIDVGAAPGATRQYAETDIWLPRLTAAGAVQWPGTLAATDIAVRIRQAWRCRIHENFIYGFTNGIVYSGCAYNTIIAKHINDNKFGVVYTTEGATHDFSFTNENIRIGGRIGNTSASISLGDSFRIVFTWDKVSSYRGGNANRFIAPCLEGNSAGTYQMPIWFDGAGNGAFFEHTRIEGCKGPVALFDGGGGAVANNTTIHLDYMAYTGQEVSIQQVNGASGNILTGVGCNTSSWNSGDLAKLVTSAGAAGTAWLRNKELFFVNASTPTTANFSRIETTFTSAIRANRQGIQLASGGAFRVCTAIDTTRIKNFECSFESIDGFIGRPCFIALDAQGNILSGLATETFANPLTGVTYANEQYVKGNLYTLDSGQFLSSGVVATPPTDLAATRAMRITVRPEVATLIFGVVGATTAAVLKSLSVIAYASYNKIGEAYPLGSGKAALRVFSLVDDDGEERIATAKPDTAGTLGYYSRGVVVYNRSAASGQPIGWQCNASGWLCPAWVGSTTYAVTGILVTNDSGKVYELTTPGTSASSGGPTGTTATWDGITDDTAKWRYIGTLATFTAMPNNP